MTSPLVSKFVVGDVLRPDKDHLKFSAIFSRSDLGFHKPSEWTHRMKPAVWSVALNICSYGRLTETDCSQSASVLSRAWAAARTKGSILVLSSAGYSKAM